MLSLESKETKTQQNQTENHVSGQKTSRTHNLIRTSPLLLRIHADDQNKKTICLFWTLLFGLASLIAILSIFAVPKLYVQQQKSLYPADAANCSFPNSTINRNLLLLCESYFNTGQIGEIIIGWIPANQFALTYLQITPVSLVDPLNQDFTANLTISVYKIRPYFNEAIQKNVILVQQPLSINSQTLIFDSVDAKPLFGQDGESKIGYSTQLAIIPHLEYYPLFISVTFNQTLSNSLILGLNLQSYAVNPEFTYYTIIVRQIFFCLSVSSLILYFIRYLKIPKNQRIFEQVLVGIASILLPMFNDPFYPITVLKPNGGSLLFSILFVVNLIVFLFFTWIVMADRIHQQDGKVGTEQVTMKKLAYTVVIWLQLSVTTMIHSMQQINTTPILSASLQATYIAAKVIIILSFLASIIYVFVRYFQIWRSQQPKLWRSKVFMVISSAFIVLIFTIVVGNQLIPYNYSGSTILLAYGLLNLYVYYLQYMFTITKQEAQNLEREDIEKQYVVERLTITSVNVVDIDPKDQRDCAPAFISDKHEITQAHMNEEELGQMPGQIPGQMFQLE